MRYKHFCKTERHELSILRKKGYSLREIAEELGKHPSSVSRELRRNHIMVDNDYVADKAHEKARKRRKAAKKNCRFAGRQTVLRDGGTGSIREVSEYRRGPSTSGCTHTMDSIIASIFTRSNTAAGVARRGMSSVGSFCIACPSKSGR
jgi:predicted DNA-binding protein YlxM (UPF0122 family)